MKNLALLALVAFTAGCANMAFPNFGARKSEPAAQESAAEPQAEEAVALAPPPPANARTQEQFDTTTAADRAAAAATPETSGEQSLGAEVVSLGDVSRSGFWLETNLVTTAGKGRVLYPATGKSAQVDLIPADSGSRLSLAAMRLIEAPLTDLPTVEVYRLP